MYSTCIRSQLSQLHFGLPLRMNGMHRTWSDRARFYLLSLVIWSRVAWPSITWNLRNAQLWSKSVLTRCGFELRSLSPAFPNLTSGKGRTVRKLMGRAGEVQKKNSRKGKLNEKKFHARQITLRNNHAKDLFSKRTCFRKQFLRLENPPPPITFLMVCP